MNDTFDIMNIRKLADALFNDVAQWERRRKILDQLLVILNHTEKMYNQMEADRKSQEKEEKRLKREQQKTDKKRKEQRQRTTAKRRKIVDVDEDLKR